MNDRLNELQRLNAFLKLELAEDARLYLDTLERANVTPEGSEERDDLEAELHAAILQLRVHAAHLIESLDDEIDAMPDDELEDKHSSPVSSV